MSGTLFDDISSEKTLTSKQKEVTSLERLRDLDKKIADAVGKVKALKEEKAALEERVRELERALNEKDEEIRRLTSEKTVIREQIEDLLNELETIEIK
jgi:septal ring factor EnvC (AmiA/AmiB activator)